MKNIQKRLEEQGHEVSIPESAIEDKGNNHWDNLKQNDPKQFAKIKGERIKLHFDKIILSEAILVLNYDKHGKKNYIGPNTFLEIGFAFGNNKKIFLVNQLPEDSNHEELLSMNLICIDNDLNRIS